MPGVWSFLRVTHLVADDMLRELMQELKSAEPFSVHVASNIDQTSTPLAEHQNGPRQPQSNATIFPHTGFDFIFHRRGLKHATTQTADTRLRPANFAGFRPIQTSHWPSSRASGQFAWATGQFHGPLCNPHLPLATWSGIYPIAT